MVASERTNNAWNGFGPQSNWETSRKTRENQDGYHLLFVMAHICYVLTRRGVLDHGLLDL